VPSAASKVAYWNSKCAGEPSVCPRAFSVAELDPTFVAGLVSAVHAESAKPDSPIAIGSAKPRML
jgi:hypothetical protein